METGSDLPSAQDAAKNDTTDSSLGHRIVGQALKTMTDPQASVRDYGVSLPLGCAGYGGCGAWYCSMPVRGCGTWYCSMLVRGCGAWYCSMPVTVWLSQ